ncbi:MAG: A/G-specific adenine glycosylase [Gammaproteobacteria bacterium]|nr:A/G-specific adenine glycosylase [Gammaproteobacteria bacterium]
MEAIHERLLAWFDAHKRDLPWRGAGDPYAVWISEVMLQQTRAAFVAPYYRRWMERFPDVGALAYADLEEVLRLWRGLGYYARARNAHRCARQVRDEHGGEFPPSADRLIALPGIGPYTAAAVASIAFGEAVPAVDGNVRRVVARLFDLPDPSLAQVRGLAAERMDRTRPGDFNEAMMELGATVCMPRSPKCGACPLAAGCRARAAGTAAERPLRRKPRPVPTRTWDVQVAVSPRGRTLVVRRPREGLLGGMWEFPAVEVEDGADRGGRPMKVAEPVVGGAGDGARAPAPRSMQVAEPAAGAVVALPPVTHRFSHFTAVYRPRRVEVAAEWGEAAGRWVTPSELADLPLPVAQQRIARAAGF